ENDSERAASNAGADIIFFMNRRLTVLSVLGSLLPLMGLLGTVIGMIKVFSRVAAAGDLTDIGILAGGIWEALITTAAGMSVAIPTLMIYHFLERRIEKTSHRMRQEGERIIEMMRNNKES
ncbi:MAG: MotA/TolQ/ExbB proton channel family protein, partial [bacterium]